MPSPGGGRVFTKSSKTFPLGFSNRAFVPPHATGNPGRRNPLSPRPRLLGINHVALEVGDVDEALAFYGSIFDLTLRGRAGRMAFVDMGDQFVAFGEGRTQAPDDHRHFGLVVDDKEGTRRALEEAGVEILPGRGLDFRDPWGNRIQVVDYRDVQFTKTDGVLRGMGAEGLEKSERALEELHQKGLAPD